MRYEPGRRNLWGAGLVAAIAFGGSASCLWAQTSHLTKPVISGDTRVTVGTIHTYVASATHTAAFLLPGHTVEYLFDWGDGTKTSYGSSKQSHSWSAKGSYNVTVVARCTYKDLLKGEMAVAYSAVSDPYGVTVSSLSLVFHTVAAPTISGPDVEKMLVDVLYKFVATHSTNKCNLGHEVTQFAFDWADKSGMKFGPSVQSHSWSSPGSYKVVAFAQCASLQKSFPSKPLYMTIQAPEAAGPLAVSPEDSSAAFGAAGGTFAPSAFSYMLTNGGNLDLEWGASIHFVTPPVPEGGGTPLVSDWLQLDSMEGKLGPAGTQKVTAVLAESAKTLPNGQYQAILRFVNLTNHTGDTERTLTLSVGGLSVSSADTLSFSRSEGNPASPVTRSVTLRNDGSTAIEWVANADQSWIALSPSQGALAPSEEIAIQVSIRSDADSFLIGSYGATLSILNKTTGIGDTTREITLDVSEAAGSPKEEMPAGGGGSGGGGGCGMIGLDALLALGILVLYRRRR